MWKIGFGILKLSFTSLFSCLLKVARVNFGNRFIRVNKTSLHMYNIFCRFGWDMCTIIMWLAKPCSCLKWTLSSSCVKQKHIDIEDDNIPQQLCQRKKKLQKGFSVHPLLLRSIPRQMCISCVYMLLHLLWVPSKLPSCTPQDLTQMRKLMLYKIFLHICKHLSYMPKFPNKQPIMH